MSFLRFSSEREVEAVAVCSSEFLMRLSWLATPSSDGRMSNQWYCLEARYPWSRTVPLAALRAAVGRLADEHLLDAVEGVGLDDAQLVVPGPEASAGLVVDDLLARLSRWMPSVNTWTSMMVLHWCPGTRSGCPFTSLAFSPKIARSSFSSGVSGRPLGVTLPTKDVAGFTSAPMRTMPDSSRRAGCSLRVRDVAGDLFLGAQLGVARHHQFLDVDRV